MKNLTTGCFLGMALWLANCQGGSPAQEPTGKSGGAVVGPTTGGASITGGAPTATVTGGNAGTGGRATGGAITGGTPVSGGAGTGGGPSTGGGTGGSPSAGGATGSGGVDGGVGGKDASATGGSLADSAVVGGSHFYVSPNGTGTDCSASAPCSLTSAQTVVRAAAKSLQGDLVVELADGTYRLKAPLLFTADDSGGPSETPGRLSSARTRGRYCETAVAGSQAPKPYPRQ